MLSDPEHVLDRHGVERVPCAAHDRCGEMLPEFRDPLGRGRENRRAINMAVIRLPQAALDVPREADLVAARPVIMRELHQREVRNLAVDLRQSN